ncbi:MAG: hypothetical protein HDR40_05440 [Lactobacillus sp.]|nr:hypothetical protein [Lactobacillus sp.]MBD5430001.1 hypothetical protein [Lactobacillus sp.]
MRMTHKVKFYRSDSFYDPDAHEFADDVKVVHEDMANVTDMGTNRSQELLGNYVKQAKVVRLLHPLHTVFDYLTIDNSDTHYRMQTQRTPLKGYTLIVGEDIANNQNAGAERT